MRSTRLLCHAYKPKQLHRVIAAWNQRTFSSCVRSKNFLLRPACGDSRVASGERDAVNYQQSRRLSLDPTLWFTWWSQTQIVLSCQSALQHIHGVTGIPWWLTIVLTTSALRLAVTFPLTVYQHIVLAKFQNLQPEIEKLAVELGRETSAAVKMFDWDQKYAQHMYKRSLKKQITKLIIRDNCHPFKSTIVIWVQLPMWISISCALRNMTAMLPSGDPAALMSFLELTVGGALWFPNLTIPDGSFILPVVLGVLNLLVVEIHALKGVKTRSKFRTGITYLMRGVSVAMIPIAASVPSCMALYWTTSSALGLAQNVLLSYPSARRSLNIPTMSDEASPVQDLLSKIKGKFG